MKLPYVSSIWIKLKSRTDLKLKFDSLDSLRILSMHFLSITTKLTYLSLAPTSTSLKLYTSWIFIICLGILIICLEVNIYEVDNSKDIIIDVQVLCQDIIICIEV